MELEMFQHRHLGEVITKLYPLNFLTQSGLYIITSRGSISLFVLDELIAACV